MPPPQQQLCYGHVLKLQVKLLITETVICN